jgi:hypothetical protein
MTESGVTSRLISPARLRMGLPPTRRVAARVDRGLAKKKEAAG